MVNNSASFVQLCVFCVASPVLCMILAFESLCPVGLAPVYLLLMCILVHSLMCWGHACLCSCQWFPCPCDSISTTISTTLHTQLWHTQNQPKCGTLHNLALGWIWVGNLKLLYLYINTSLHHLASSFTHCTSEHSHHMDNTSLQDHHTTTVTWIE